MSVDLMNSTKIRYISAAYKYKFYSENLNIKCYIEAIHKKKGKTFKIFRDFNLSLQIINTRHVVAQDIMFFQQVALIIQIRVGVLLRVKREIEYTLFFCATRKTTCSWSLRGRIQSE